MTDGNANQTQSGMPNCSRHSPNLSISPLGQRDLQPCRGHALAITDGRLARRKQRLFTQQSNFRRPGPVVADDDPRNEALQSFFIRTALHLYPVSSWMTELRIRESMLQGAVVRQQHQPLTVMIEPTCRINIRDREVLLERAPLARKLATNTERLVEENVTVEQISDYSIL